MSGNRSEFWNMRTAPFGGLRSRETLDRVFSQTPSGKHTGPFPAPHLASIGVQRPGLGSGFRRDFPPDRIIYAYDSRMPIRDFEPGGAEWLISSNARRILERFAGSAIDVAPVELYVRYKSEDRPVEHHWLCDVIRFEDVVDEGASTIHWNTRNPQYGTGSRLVFQRNLPADLHLFRIWKAPGWIACSGALRNALREAGMSGVAFAEF